MALLNFDATAIAPDAGKLDPIPAGWYNAAMEESELKPTKAGDGAYLSTRFKVLDGEFVNRKLFSMFNLKNPNPVAEEIGRAQLSAVAHACGVLQVADSQQLHGIPIKIRVKVTSATKDDKGNIVYEAKNDITAYKNINEQVGGAAPAGAGAQQSMPAGFFNQSMPQPAPAQAAPQPQQAAPVSWQAPAAQQPWANQPPQPAAQPPQPPAQPPQATQQPSAQQQPSWAAQSPAQPPQQAAPPQQVPAGPQPAPEAVQAVQVASPPWMQKA